MLGTTLDKKLTLKAYVQAGTKTALYNINLIQNVWNLLTIDTMKMLMLTLVLAQIDYFNSILTNRSCSSIKPYQNVQNFAARITLKIPRRDSIHQGLKTLHWLPVQFRTIFKLLCLVYNGLKGSGPIYLQNKLKGKTHERRTRQSTDQSFILQTPFNRKKTLAARGFAYMAAIHWNNLASSN